jgi:PAS domain S-box-containing protein
LGQWALAKTDLPALMNEAVKRVAGTLEVEYCAVLELLPGGEELLAKAGVGWKQGVVGQATVGARLDSQAGYTMYSSEPVIVEDLRSERRFDSPALLNDHNVTSGISVVISHGGRPFGILGAYSKERRKFTEDDVNFLRAVANVLATAIERRQIEETLRFLTKAGEVLSSSLDYRTTLASVARLSVPTLADWCAVDIVNDDGSLERLAVEHPDPEKIMLAYRLEERYPPDPDSAGGVHQAIRTGQPLMMSEIPAELVEQVARDEEHKEILRKLGLCSYMVVPLVARAKILGAISFVTAESGRIYREADLELAQELSHRAALAVDNAWLYEEAHKEIAERQWAQQELRGSRDQLEIILGGVADGITAQDGSGRLFYANAAAARMCGFSSVREFVEAPVEEVLSKFEILDEEGDPFTLERLPGRRALGGEQEAEQMLRFRILETGEERWSLVRAAPVFDEEGRVRMAVNIMRDVTEQRRAQQERARLGAIVESSEDAIISKTLEGVITSWNRGAQRIYGYSSEEIVGQSITILVPPERPDEIPEILAKLRRGEKIEHYETVRVTKDGRRLDISLSISPIRDHAGNVTGASTIARDITERKRTEDEIRHLNEVLDQRIRDRTAQLAEANQELESFSYSVSHDLRAPLRHIGGFAEMLHNRAASSLDEVSLRYLKTILTSVEHAGALVDDLLAFSRMGRVEMRDAPLDMNQLVGKVLDEIKLEAAGRNVHWKVDTLPEVRGDPSMLRLVVENLLSNAVKYSRPRDPAVIEVGSTSNEREIVFFVRDNGIGFDVQYLDKLFGVFQRLHSAEEFEGTGIGLASVRRIVNRHEGRVWADGCLGKGATFYFSLPRCAENGDG